MLFNSIEFLIFLPIVLILFYGIPKKFKWILLLVASYYFYGSWKVTYLSLLAISTVIDFVSAQQIAKTNNVKVKKFFLFLSLCANLGILFYFKYAGFFTHEFSKAFETWNVYLKSFENIVLPVGISFYTFQSMSYTIDVYRGKLKPSKHIGLFALYVAYFPQLVAGPIERAGHLLNQFSKFRKVHRSDVYFGITRILLGFFKKLVVADRLAIIVNSIYDNPSGHTGADLAIGTVFFAFQIYCDFSGYSDIAIGVSRLMGINIMENFRAPYLAKSLNDFWGRWHISLSTWFRDYVYIPLGGNRVIKWRFYYNLLITFTVSGLWHGAEWTFLIWGFIHGIWLIFEKTTKFNKLSLHKSLKIIITFFIVCVGWVFFRANNLDDSLLILGKIFNIADFGIPTNIDGTYYEQPLWRLLGCFGLVAVVLVLDYCSQYYIKIYKAILRHPKSSWAAFSLILLSIVALGVFDTNEFIYFQF